MNQNIDKQIEFFKKYFEGLKKLITESRKKGLDTKIAELRMMNIPFKIQYLEITKSKADAKKVKRLLALLEREIPRE
jgi:hypothetical protein